MSQKATRKSQNVPAADDKEKADTPVKDMKKKLAANAEKDKQAAEKTDKTADKDKNDTASKKPADKSVKNEPVEKKSTEKPDKNGEKADALKDKADKKTDKVEKAADKKQDKNTEKKPVEKKDAQEKEDKNKESGAALNGSQNGTGAHTVSDSDDEFPELAYDTDSEPEDAPPRSHTRRDQVKATKTPDTPAPRPASETNNDDSKVLKLKDDAVSSDRKLRSADSPKPDAKKTQEKKAQDSPSKQDAAQEEEKKSTKKDLEASKKDVESSKSEESEAQKKEDDKTEKIEVVAEAESSEGVAYRTRARVSPYTRTRLDKTSTSVMADYTGNNSTMEMDITESSVAEESLNESGYLRGLRGIRGRSSYKLLSDIKLTHPNANKPRPTPTAAVVGRKRKPSPPPEPALEAREEVSHGKRMKLFDRLAMPWRSTRSAEIVGINTDLPLTAPVASSSFASFDPETIKAAPVPAPGEPVATPLAPPTTHDRDGKRCSIM